MKRLNVVALLSLLLVVLGACGAESATPTTAPTTASTTAPVAGKIDLAGREVSIAVENLYPPFNYINPQTGKGEGWDYDAWTAICAELNQFSKKPHGKA